MEGRPGLLTGPTQRKDRHVGLHLTNTGLLMEGGTPPCRPTKGEGGGAPPLEKGELEGDFLTVGSVS